MFPPKKLVYSYLIIVLALLGPVLFWMSNRQSEIAPGPNSTRNETSAPSSVSNDNRNQNTKQWSSLGEKILITADDNLDKQAGTKAIASGDLAGAVQSFRKSLQTNRNDPEALIYLNNALASETGNIVKIAVSVPIGGNLNVAKEILRGVAQAQDETNRNGGVDGKKVLIEIANDNNDPEMAKTIASELVKDTSILAVIGHNDSNASLAAAPIYQKGGLIAISPTSIANDLSEIGNYIFRTVPSSRILADPLARYAVESARKAKIAICVDSQSKTSASFQQEISLALFEYGGKLTKTKCDFSSPTFNADDIPSQAISDGADALLLAPSVNRINKALDVARANRGRLSLFGSQSIYGFDTLQQGQSNVNGMVLSVIWHPAKYTNKTFMADAKKLWGGYGSWRTATSYDAAKAAIAGLKYSTTREQLEKTLSNPDFSVDGATGKVEFQQSGDRNVRGVLVKVQPGNNSGTGYDFVPIE
jgi:branched-chain amino acid transport system substrate-binding protein